MWVRLKYKTKEGKCYRLNREMTVKQAIGYYKGHLKNDKNIIKVWLSHFDEWHEYLYKVLKEEE